MITVKHLMMISISALAMACAPKEPVKYLALSFDDGPNLTTESKMLDVLAKHEVPATFFVIGNNINEESARNMKRALELGCEIGNHALTHSMMSQMDEEQVKAEIEATSVMIEQITGQRPKFFRPPYINVKPEMYDWIDLTFICGKGCEDWVATVGKEARREGIIANAEPGAIYLLHDFDGNEATVEALDEAIPVLKEQGYVFVTVAQLFEKLQCAPDGHTMYTVVPDGRKKKLKSARLKNPARAIRTG
ncbi:MAG: polysaccharide deacetylase family protein [Bacteroidales bacterium]|nr:polysaccharide deacetylase family protein [Bacteroidales bacterium]